MHRRASRLVPSRSLLSVWLLLCLLQPQRASSATLPLLTGDTLLDRAEAVALGVLEANQMGGTHSAAPFYRAPWLRDSFAWGMVPDDAGTLSTFARSELSYWLGQQRPFGGWITLDYSGWYDETPILITAVLDAYRQTGDRAMVHQALPALQRGWQWLNASYVDPKQGSSCLIYAVIRPSGAHWATDWADQVARQGYSPQLEGLWYSATHAMAALELLDGNPAAAAQYAATASCIATDVNRLLWDVSAPAHVDALPLAAVGHYRARPAGRDYFEIDGNALLIANGVADPSQSAAILGAIQKNAGQLLGVDRAGPARVLYGDYAPQDYGPLHQWIASDRYQNAYWPTVGGLLAIAAAHAENPGLALSVLQGLARRAVESGSGFNEWYDSAGQPGGAAFYSWGARMYLLALYRAYLGIDDSDSVFAPADLMLRSAPGAGRADLVRLGRHITIICHGSGRFRYATLGRRVLSSPLIPASLLTDGATLEVYRR